MVIDTSKIAILEDNERTKLTEEEWQSIEQIFQKAINDYNQNTNNKIDVKNYLRQYVVSENETGEKKVWINCFCDKGEEYRKTRRKRREKYGIITTRDNWKEEVVQVLDGGKCYFNLTVNLSNETYYDFSINGEA